jgi:hypothetical protein
MAVGRVAHAIGFHRLHEGDATIRGGRIKLGIKWIGTAVEFGLVGVGIGFLAVTTLVLKKSSCRIRKSGMSYPSTVSRKSHV